MKKYAFVFAISCFVGYSTSYSQNLDSSKVIPLNDVLIKNQHVLGGIERMPDVKDNVIFAGKKTEVINLTKLNADLSTNNTRQVFAKIPGMSVWENDGSGIQAGLATRGLSPNRSWEFNVRQNGYDICSEIFGYPETYFTPPMESVEKIEVIRGAASLQFGPQFGGLLNYQIKKGNTNKAIGIETQQTIGSFGLLNTYNAIGGTYKKLSYYAYFHNRVAEGWRENSQYAIHTGYFSANYQLSKRINIAAEYTNMNYKSQQAGGLTDVQFNENNKQSFRERNWFGAPWNVTSLTFKYDISRNVNLQIKSFMTMAERNSVGFTKSITTLDTINPLTLQYNARQVDRDYYSNYGTEARVSVKYNLCGNSNVLAAGIRLHNGKTKRNQLGTGTTGSDFDLTLNNSTYGRSLEFSTINYAAFAENIFQIGKHLKLIPGIRIEFIENSISGYINTSQTGTLNSDKRVHKILLYGFGTEYKVTDKTNIYGNYSLAYRPVTFSEITPSATTEIIDPNLKNASGFNADFGYRGNVKNFLNFDIGIFYLQYNNRIGTITQNSVPFKTNIGTSISKGIESYIEINPIKIFTENVKLGTFSIYASNSFIDAKYTEWNNPLIANNPLLSIANKRVENAPLFIHRFGGTYYLKEFSLTFQYSTVSDVYTDAANTELANVTGTIGKLSGYKIMDASCSYRFLKNYNVKAGINNITDEKYATRRSTGYPGPGLLPGNGRNLFISVGASF